MTWSPASSGPVRWPTTRRPEVRRPRKPFADGHKFASTQVDLVGAARERVLAIGALVADEDLADDGRETDPHVTVRYGLHTDQPDEVAAAIAGTPPVALTLDRLDSFQSDERDVLIVAVESPDLVALNARLGTLPHTDTHDGYVPHATVAYLKPGRAAAYVDRLPPLGVRVTADRITFSPAAGPSAELPLGGPREFATDATDPDDDPLLQELFVGEPVEIDGLHLDPIPTGPPRTFADTPPLGGPDGRDLARLVREAKAEGVRVLADAARSAVKRLVAGDTTPGRLFNDDELMRVADALAGVNATADLLARSRVREQAERAGAAPFRAFADEPAIRIKPPEEAVGYFRGLVPSLDVDPDRFGESMRRQAFTLAVGTDEVLLANVQAAITRAIEEGVGTADATADVDAILDAAGVSPANPQYAEAVFRTNAHESYLTAAYEEMRHPDVRDAFPVWEYLAVDDERSRPHHAARKGKFYPAAVAFVSVRGTDAKDAINCRCNFRAVGMDEWAELEAAGAEMESTW